MILSATRDAFHVPQHYLTDGPSEDCRIDRVSSQTFIVPLGEIISSFDLSLADAYENACHPRHQTPAAVERSTQISQAANAALYAWSNVQFLGASDKTDQQLLEDAKQRNCWRDPALWELTERLFLALAPYMRSMVRDDPWVIDTIQWSDSLGSDMVATVNYIRLY